MPLSVCFVCLGNICRSPMAEAVFANIVFSVMSWTAELLHITLETIGSDRTFTAKSCVNLPLGSSPRRRISKFDYLLSRTTATQQMSWNSNQSPRFKASVFFVQPASDKLASSKSYYGSGSRKVSRSISIKSNGTQQDSIPASKNALIKYIDYSASRVQKRCWSSPLWDSSSLYALLTSSLFTTSLASSPLAYPASVTVAWLCVA
jgi:hypothetical protein